MKFLRISQVLFAISIIIQPIHAGQSQSQSWREWASSAWSQISDNARKATDYLKENVNGETLSNLWEQAKMRKGLSFGVTGGVIALTSLACGWKFIKNQMGKTCENIQWKTGQEGIAPYASQPIPFAYAETQASPSQQPTNVLQAVAAPAPSPQLPAASIFPVAPNVAPQSTVPPASTIPQVNLQPVNVAPQPAAPTIAAPELGTASAAAVPPAEEKVEPLTHTEEMIIGRIALQLAKNDFENLNNNEFVQDVLTFLKNPKNLIDNLYFGEFIQQIQDRNSDMGKKFNAYFNEGLWNRLSQDLSTIKDLNKHKNQIFEIAKNETIRVIDQNLYPDAVAKYVIETESKTNPEEIFKTIGIDDFRRYYWHRESIKKGEGAQDLEQALKDTLKTYLVRKYQGIRTYPYEGIPIEAIDALWNQFENSDVVKNIIAQATQTPASAALTTARERLQHFGGTAVERATPYVQAIPGAVSRGLGRITSFFSRTTPEPTTAQPGPQASEDLTMSGFEKIGLSENEIKQAVISIYFDSDFHTHVLEELQKVVQKAMKAGANPAQTIAAAESTINALFAEKNNELDQIIESKTKDNKLKKEIKSDIKKREYERFLRWIATLPKK